MAPLNIRPPSERYQDICDWAEKNVIIPPGNSRPGPIKLASYQRGILEAYTDPSIQRITMMMASQIGKTQMVSIMLGYDICCQPQPVMLVNSTESDTKKFVTTKLIPFIDTCPELASRVAKKRSSKGTFNNQVITFEQGRLTLAHAGSGSNLRSLTVSRTIADEVDAYEASIDGGPLDIIAQRMITFEHPKMVVLSTPRTDNRASLIEREYLKGDQRKFYVPCPYCAEIDILYWEHVAIDVARYRCPHCQELWTDDDRLDAVEHGEWRPTNPFAFAGHASFHLTQLYSVLVNLRVTVNRYNEGDIRSFYSQALAIPYEEVEQSEIDESELLRYVVKESTCSPPQAITCGVDVQGDRLEYQIVEWRASKACVVKHGSVPVMLANNGDDTWRLLRDAMAPYEPDMTFVDSSYKPDFVRSGLKNYFPTSYRTEIIFDIQGLPGDSFGKIGVDDKRKRGGALAISTDELKAVQYDMIKNGEISFVESGINAQFLSQFASERLEYVTSKATGKTKMQWVKMKDRNEALDCFIYALAAKKKIEIDRPDYDRSGLGTTYGIILV